MEWLAWQNIGDNVSSSCIMHTHMGQHRVDLLNTGSIIGVHIDDHVLQV